MKEKSVYQNTVKKSCFPVSVFGIYLVVLLLMSGMHTGLIVLANEMGWGELVQTIIPMIYWSMVAACLTFFTRYKMKRVYEEPLHMLADATEKVANGDFSVYVPTLHSMDELDYLDVMILDFDRMVEALGSVETLKTDFISNVSHEMKTPIAIIKNYAELLKKEELTEESRLEYAKTIEETVTRLSNLITNILKLNKLDNQTIDPEIEKYDVCRQLSECMIAYEDAWEKKELEIDAEMEDCAYVNADKSLLELVWNNLLSNAIKFTEKGGKMKVMQYSDENSITITVSDTGCGMSKEVVDHIFDKFYQGDTSHSKEGNGLGLALVKRVLELMNGEIAVKSVQGEGSTFIVTLPKAKD